jgi:hypothetical protein
VAAAPANWTPVYPAEATARQVGLPHHIACHRRLVNPQIHRLLISSNLMRVMANFV